MNAYTGHLAAIGYRTDNLAVLLACWARRNEPDATARRCAGDAVGAIDATIAELHMMRARLIGEMRLSDDQADIRADALLRRSK